MSKEGVSVHGSCLCGKVHYSCRIYPDKIFNCHCQFCRKAHGADYVTLALAKGSTLVIADHDGQLKEHKNAIGGYRAFCGACGSRLMNYGPDKTVYFSVTLSSVDTPIAFQAVAHVNVESKAPWCPLSEGIPAFAALPRGVLE